MGRATAKAQFDMSRVKTKSVEIIIYSLVDNVSYSRLFEYFMSCFSNNGV